VDAGVLHQLLVADRQFILLKLREATFGEHVRGSIPCPWPECGKRVGVSFSTRDIPVTASVDKGPVYTLTLSPEAMPDSNESDRTVAFRLPTGADQELISPLLQENEAVALSGLLTRCLRRIGMETSVDGACVSELSPLARLEIEQEMERVAPRVDLLMDAVCVECGRELTTSFDLQHFFFGELQANVDLLYREVHYLAFHYHWAEREIMDMPRDRRRRYISVLADEIEQLNEHA
jgi:hypothetical protein